MENQELSQQFKTLFDQHITSYAQNNQYGVSFIPYHTHMGVDSPQIDPANLLGFPTISVTTATTAPTDSPANGTIRFYYDGTNYIQWTRINNTWVGTRAGISIYPSWFPPHVLFDHYATIGNTHTDGTVDDLYSDTIAASQLANNGEKLEAEYGGSFVTSATATREVQVFFGGTSIFDTGALTISLSSAWTCYVSIIRVSATVIRYMVSFTTEGAALAAYTAVGELTGLTLSNTNILKITGQAAGVGAAASDVTAKMGTVVWWPTV